LSDIDVFIISDRAFHRKLAEMSGNQVLRDFTRNLHERSWRRSAMADDPTCATSTPAPRSA
jgi:DNA-binding FadR family transcriptional regulator